ncbi:MAG: hypothetical protein WC715_05635 [Patescibacteria group bacterium]|jgi:hypothetical protein
MSKLRDNQYYFEISKKRKEDSLDEFYVFDIRHPDLNKYLQNTKEIKNILITIKTLQDKKENPRVIDKYFLELSGVIGKFSNCSEFACFVNACDNIIDEIMECTHFVGHVCPQKSTFGGNGIIL